MAAGKFRVGDEVKRLTVVDFLCTWERWESIRRAVPENGGC